jgi:protein-disulfide isomerase
MSEDGASRLSRPVGDDDHQHGPADAPVTLVEYGDYECPYCGAAHPIVQAIQKEMGDRLRFVFRNFPLTQIHPHAAGAAEAAEAAGDQNAFWPYHDHLFEHQYALSPRDLAGYAGEFNLDAARFERALESHEFEERVRADFMSGVRSGVNGTPTFFINGVRHDDSYDYEVLLAALNEAKS